MDIKSQTNLFFFDSFGANGLKSFIIQDDQKMTEKILLGTEQLTRTDNKITLVKIKFSLNSCKNLSKKELNNSSDTVRDFFYFLQSFGDKLELRDFCKYVGSRRPYPRPEQCRLRYFSNIFL